jgi:nitrite reductase (cytochrome c-552)
MNESSRGKFPTVIVVIAVSSALLGVGITALLVNIFTHRQEAKSPFFRVVDITDDMVDPAEWGKNFPLQYDGYKRTVDQIRTRYGGSEAVPRTPTKADPRSVVAQSRLEEDPRLKALWAGYAFSRDFREERGHAFMLTDQLYTERQQAVQQPGACLHCHASVYVAYRTQGHGDVTAGFEKVNPMPYAQARQLISHPIACIDCHDPKDMELRITRPAFMEGIRELKKSQGNASYDVNREATRQEMRSFVCAQCHVEYYFKGPEKRLVYPWANGLSVDAIYEYYEKVGHKDWVHAQSKAPVLKAQHPEFELWSTGIHARSQVACADCHMPYRRVGAHKISDHHVRSPMLNIPNACQTCHHWPEAELKARVERTQETVFTMRNHALDAVLDLVTAITRAETEKKPGDRIEKARAFQRKAQFFLDFVEAENSTGFHSPQEALRILGESIDYSRKGLQVL